jgi:hypothetical protein
MTQESSAWLAGLPGSYCLDTLTVFLEDCVATQTAKTDKNC